MKERPNWYAQTQYEPRLDTSFYPLTDTNRPRVGDSRVHIPARPLIFEGHHEAAQPV